MRAKKLADYAIILNPQDNVATALKDVPAGEYALSGDGSPCAMAVPETIQAGFKIALQDIAPGELICKYGYPIGVATTAIRRGSCVHVHNVASRLAERGTP
jgi:altronate hydrolase